MPKAFNYPLNIPHIFVEGIELEISESVNFDAFNDAFVKGFEKHLKKIAYEGKDFWSTEAGRRLNTSREATQKSLGVTDNGNGTFTVTLGGRGGRGTASERWLAKAVEAGIPSYDMKPGLLAGSDLRRIRLADGHFRMVSPKQKDKWIHPGLEARNIQEAVTEHLKEKLIPQYSKKAFDDALKKMSKKKKK